MTATVAAPGAEDGVRPRPFAGAGVTGWTLLECPGDDLVGEVERVLDPASAERTVHWGRNYLYETRLRVGGRDTPVVVKQFRNQGLRRRLDRRRRGSKAVRAWRAALAVLDAGLLTPRPVVVADSDRLDGPSFYVCEVLEGATEIRHFFRRLNPGGDPPERFPEVEPEVLLGRLGALCRRLHDAGVVHRDLSMGNVLARSRDDRLELWLVDLDRARTGRSPGRWRRMRDICRFPVRRPDHVSAMLGGYWGRTPPAWSWPRMVYVASVRAYILKHAVKNRLRRLLPWHRSGHGGSSHPHIPQAQDGASARDRSVWDALSDQPHQHASRWQKYRLRAADAPSHARDLAAVVAAAPGVVQRYRQLRAGLYRHPVAFAGIGLAVRPDPDHPRRHLDAILGLGVEHVLVRLHPWEEDHRAELELIRELTGRGVDVCCALPQNRELVRDRARWRAAVERVAEAFGPYVRTYQVGHAVNRSKWGIWTTREYQRLFRDAAEVLRRLDGAELMGPAVIDFELQTTLALVRRTSPDVFYDIVASLLYVDRRGAPENPQLGFDTVGKALLLRAIAEAGRACGDRCWVTEVNWPLWEGPHSPAGRTVAVDEETQANYLVRYYVLVLTTGAVERVYWWRLQARGYGLAVVEGDGSLRLRPAYRALEALTGRLQGWECHGVLATGPEARAFVFRRGEGLRVVAWGLRPGVPVDLPGRVVAMAGRDGDDRPVPPEGRLELGPGPVYADLDPTSWPSVEASLVREEATGG